MSAFSWGGSEELWFKVASLALEKNYQIQVCTEDWVNLPVKINQLKNLGAKLALRKKPNSNIKNRLLRLLKINTVPNYINSIIRYNPDVILVSQGATFDFFYHEFLYNLLMKLKKPYFLISQFNYEYGHLQSQTIRNRLINPAHLWNKFYFVAERNLLTACRQVAHTILNTEIVSNPVNIKNESSVKWPKEEILKMACVARYDCDYKGQDILLFALRSFKEENFIINFYGSGPDELVLKSLIEVYGLKGKAFINKHVTDIDAIWQNHHILILPSIAEGTPLSLQEALIKGRPALVTDVGGNSTLIVDGQTGFLADYPSAISITKKLEILFKTDLKNLKKMGEKATIKALSTINFQSAEDILKDIVNA